MASGIARRIQWLYPVEREVYRTWKSQWFSEQAPACVRCGARVGYHDVSFAIRDRGSFFKGKETHSIHRRCVPTAEFETAGLPARRLRKA